MEIAVSFINILITEETDNYIYIYSPENTNLYKKNSININVDNFITLKDILNIDEIKNNETFKFIKMDDNIYYFKTKSTDNDNKNLINTLISLIKPFIKNIKYDFITCTYFVSEDSSKTPNSMVITSDSNIIDGNTFEIIMKAIKLEDKIEKDYSTNLNKKYHIVGINRMINEFLNKKNIELQIYNNRLNNLEILSNELLLKCQKVSNKMYKAYPIIQKIESINENTDDNQLINSVLNNSFQSLKHIIIKIYKDSSIDSIAKLLINVENVYNFETKYTTAVNLLITDYNSNTLKYKDYLEKLEKKINDAIITYLKINCANSYKKYNENRYRIHIEKKDKKQIIIQYNDDYNIKSNEDGYIFNTETQTYEKPDSPSIDNMYNEVPKYLLGNFTKIFDIHENNEDIVNKMDNITNKIMETETPPPIFIIGYGSSGAGKTSNLIYLRDTENPKNSQPGVLPFLCSKIIKEHINANHTFEKLNLVVKEYSVYTINNSNELTSNNYEFEYKEESIVLKAETELKIQHKYRFKFDMQKYLLDNPDYTGLIIQKEDDKYYFNYSTQLGDIVKFLVDVDRIVKATTNNPQSSRSHVLVFVEIYLINKPKIVKLIVGDFAGIENEFMCTDVNTLDKMFSLKNTIYKNEKTKKFTDKFYLNEVDLNIDKDTIFGGNNIEMIDKNDVNLLESIPQSSFLDMYNKLNEQEWYKDEDNLIPIYNSVYNFISKEIDYNNGEKESINKINAKINTYIANETIFIENKIKEITPQLETLLENEYSSGTEYSKFKNNLKQLETEHEKYADLNLLKAVKKKLENKDDLIEFMKNIRTRINNRNDNLKMNSNTIDSIKTGTSTNVGRIEYTKYLTENKPGMHIETDELPTHIVKPNQTIKLSDLLSKIFISVPEVKNDDNIIVKYTKDTTTTTTIDFSKITDKLDTDTLTPVKEANNTLNEFNNSNKLCVILDIEFTVDNKKINYELYLSFKYTFENTPLNDDEDKTKYKFEVIKFDKNNRINTPPDSNTTLARLYFLTKLKSIEITDYKLLLFSAMERPTEPVKDHKSPNLNYNTELQEYNKLLHVYTAETEKEKETNDVYKIIETQLLNHNEATHDAKVKEITDTIENIKIAKNDTKSVKNILNAIQNNNIDSFNTRLLNDKINNNDDVIYNLEWNIFPDLKIKYKFQHFSLYALSIMNKDKNNDIDITKFVKFAINKLLTLNRICDNRLKEGKWINYELKELRKAIEIIIKSKNFDIFYNYIDTCFTNTGYNPDNPPIKIDDINNNRDIKNTFIESIFNHYKTINGIQYNNINDLAKDMIICIYCVFNYGFKEDPPNAIYLNIDNLNKIKKINKETFGNIITEFSIIKNTITTKNLNEILISEVIINEMDIKKLKKNVLNKEDLDKNKFKLEYIIDTYFTNKKIETNEKNYTVLFNLIKQHINNINSISGMGSLEFLDQIAKLNKTNYFCTVDNIDSAKFKNVLDDEDEDEDEDEN